MVLPYQVSFFPLPTLIYCHYFPVSKTSSFRLPVFPNPKQKLPHFTSSGEQDPTLSRKLERSLFEIRLDYRRKDMAARTVAKDIITLRGSAAIVSEFFGYAANSILYNRGVYPEESFVKVKKYGLPMLLTEDEGVKSFLANLTAQLSEWLEAGKLQRVVLVIMSKATSEVLERWNFSIETDSEVVEKGVSREKSDKEIMREIQAIMRQIASSITYLPCLDEPCVFDVLAYTDKDVAVPFTWVESDPKLIANPQMVKLHSFDTKIHNVNTLVSYKNDEWDEQ